MKNRNKFLSLKNGWDINKESQEQEISLDELHLKKGPSSRLINSPLQPPDLRSPVISKSVTSYTNIANGCMNQLTRFRNTSQKFDDVRVWFQLLHCVKFRHQISLVRFCSVTQRLKPAYNMKGFNFASAIHQYGIVSVKCHLIEEAEIKSTVSIF